MERRVKIVATLGPAVAGRERLVELMVAGADMVRVNAAHGDEEERARLIDDVRAASAELGKLVPILFDLRGLKIRTGPLEEGGSPVPFARGSEVTIVASPEPTREGLIGINYPNLLDVIQVGSRILIADGLIELLVDRIEGSGAVCKVGRGGLLQGKQGVTLPGAPITGGALTPDDRKDVAFAVGHGVDFLGLSFINDASDLVLARGVAGAHGATVPGLIAKIERPEALNNVHDIAQQADGLMVARGDLGVQLPPERVPRAQKSIIQTGNRMGVPVITATQMLESMIENPRPTRAEASDVANAVLDGSDAVMLSAETAAGKHPARVVQVMAEIILEAERHRRYYESDADPSGLTEAQPLSSTDAISLTACRLAQTVGAAGIACLTSSGATARAIARHRPGVPVFAFTDVAQVVGQMGLVWGTEAFEIPFQEDTDTGVRHVTEFLRARGLVAPGSRIVITGGMPLPEKGATNMVHVTMV